LPYSVVLLVSHLFHPLDNLAEFFFLANGNMRHGTVRSGPVPVLDAHRTNNDVTRPDFLNRFAPFLRPAHAGSDDQNLPHRMDMPVGASARLKGHTAAAGTHLIVGRVQRVNTHIAGKKLLRPLAGSLLNSTDNRLRLAQYPQAKT